MKDTLFLVCLIGITFACITVKAGPRVYLVAGKDLRIYL